MDAMLVFAELGPRAGAPSPLLGHLPATFLLDRGGGATPDVLAALATGERRAAYVPPGRRATSRTAGPSTRGTGRAACAAPPVGEDGTVSGEVALGARRAGRRRARRRRGRRGRPRARCSSSGRRRRAVEPVQPLRRDALARPRRASTARPARVLDARRRRRVAAAWYLAQALLAAESLGAVEVALEVSVQYAKERFTFGRAIGSYQAVKHELVEVLRRLENARSLMYYAGWAGAGQAGGVAPRRVGASGCRRARRSSTPRARRSPCTAASARRGSTTRRCTSAARSSRGGCSAGRPTRPTAWPASCSRRRGAARRRRRSARGPCWSGRTTAAASRSRRHKLPDRASTPLLRERVMATACARRRGPRGRAGAVGALARGAGRRARRAHPQRRAERARAARARAAVVAGARRARAAHRRAGTLAAARARAGAPASAMNLGGGTHHAGRDFARGYCLFNDVAVALARAARARALAQRAVVVDCDVHQGDGTAQIFAARPDALHALAARRAQLPVPAHPVRPRRRPAERARATTRTCARSSAALATRAAGASTSRSTSPAPTRGRATGSAAWRSPRPACAPATSSCWTAARRTGVAGVRRARRRLRARTSRDTVDINAATVAAVAARAR